MESDQAYRRGTILGLTIAEVFILLVFLLLLMLLLLTGQSKEKRAEDAALEEDKEKMRQILSIWRDPWSIPTPEEVEALHDRAGKVSTLEKERNEALEQIEDLKKAFDLAERERGGQNTPCWYEIRVNERKTYRKPHYLLNIAIFDDAMIIRPRPFPEGAAADDGGEPYAMEAQRLPLAGIPYGEPLDDRTLRRYLKPIHDLGKAAKVRTYPCIFWVAVWDETSEGAKARWQQAHDRVLEGLFGTYTFRDVPWPGG